MASRTPAPGREPSRKQRSRLLTEAALEESAFQLLKEEGVLAGLNVRIAAERAGVNRGIVYHYYGSKRELLRRALKRKRAEILQNFRNHAELPFRERELRLFAELTRDSGTIQLAALLVTDGDEDFELIPALEQSRQSLERDVSEGRLGEHADLEAIHSARLSLICGYALFRERLAAEFDIPQDELDRRMACMFYQMLDGVRAANRAVAQDDSDGRPPAASSSDRR